MSDRKFRRLMLAICAWGAAVAAHYVYKTYQEVVQARAHLNGIETRLATHFPYKREVEMLEDYPEAHEFRPGATEPYWSRVQNPDGSEQDRPWGGHDE